MSTNTVVIGEDLSKRIITFPRLNQKYAFENIGKYVINFRKNA
jgi:hypothetical protein